MSLGYTLLLQELSGIADRSVNPTVDRSENSYMYMLHYCSQNLMRKLIPLTIYA